MNGKAINLSPSMLEELMHRMQDFELKLEASLDGPSGHSADFHSDFSVMKAWLNDAVNEGIKPDAASLDQTIEQIASREDWSSTPMLAANQLIASSILDLTQDAVIVLEGFIGVECTESAARVFGLRRDDILERDFLELIAFRYKDNSKIWQEKMLCTLNDVGTAVFEFTRKNEVGESIWFEVTLNHLEQSGRSLCVVIAREITPQKAFENESERLKLLANAFDSAKEGVTVLREDGRICEANPEFEKMIGRSRDSLLGCLLSDLMVWSETETFEEVVADVAKGTPWFGHINVTGPHSGKRSFWVSLSPAFDEDGELGNIVALFSDITQIEKSQKELHRQALHDNLTGLPNRRFFFQKICELIEAPEEERFAVCFLDLDDFKIVNDTLGHDAGDQLLVEVSRRIQDQLDSDCFLSRLGGDEFALLVPEKNCGEERAYRVAQNILTILTSPFKLGVHEAYVGVSIGLTYYPTDGDDFESLIRNADVAMYQAKDEGKNKISVFTHTLVELIDTRQQMIADLRCALDNQELFLVYQPKLDLQTMRVSGCEALVRWQRPNSVFVPPSEFIPLAEQTGLICTIGERVLKEACLQAKKWHRQGILSGPIAINLSPRQFKQKSFIHRFRDVISRTGARPEWIEIEITENAMMENLDRALELMDEMHKLGVSVAIDDFGTGYSSLNYLKSLPLQTLKIDTSFVADVPNDPKAVAVCKTIVSLGRGLGLQVVAEGVEHEAKFDFLKSEGVELIQGFYVSEAMPATEFARWVTQRPILLNGNA